MNTFYSIWTFTCFCFHTIGTNNVSQFEYQLIKSSPETHQPSLSIWSIRLSSSCCVFFGQIAEVMYSLVEMGCLTNTVLYRQIVASVDSEADRLCQRSLFQNRRWPYTGNCTTGTPHVLIPQNMRDHEIFMYCMNLCHPKVL